MVWATKGEIELVNSLLVSLVASCRSDIEEMTRTGRTVAIEHMLRGDNQTAGGLANGTIDKELHTEVPLLQVAPIAIARLSRNFEAHSNFLRGYGASENTFVFFFWQISMFVLLALLRSRLAALTNAFKLLPHVPSPFLFRTPVRSTNALSYTRPCRDSFSPRRSPWLPLCDLV